LTIQEIYSKYLTRLNNDTQAARYKGKERFFHSSGAGLCTRKHYYSAVEQVEGKSFEDKTLRIFRIGNLIHEDIQNALREYAEQEGMRIFIEKELFIDEYNVRGFIDLALVEDNVIYDIKTCNSYKWTKMFGAMKDRNPSVQYEMQLATYGFWYQENYGELNGMKILYYNKNNSDMREVDVPMVYLDKADAYWEMCNDVVIDKDKPPPINLGNAPVYQWECGYCQYNNICEGIGKKWSK